ncbi:MAG: DUF2267 domain-containing protein [Anaerolineales bacterium]|nr:DUF2267 domain-containing protein [Anaerolineales bacterium]MCB8952657.1 DUF2267 domain-containing protein [Ardenticatenales bacterium]
MATTKSISNLEQFYQYVQEAGSLRTPQHARRWSEATLKTLALNLDRGTKKALAHALPSELADALLRIFWLAHFRDQHLPVLKFQKQVANRSGATDAQFARKPVSAVFHGLKALVNDDGLRQRVAQALSPEVRHLWEEA